MSAPKKFWLVEEFEAYCQRSGQITANRLAFRVGRNADAVLNAVKAGKLAPDEYVKYSGPRAVPLFKESRIVEIKKLFPDKKAA